jgi:hypothetical protein
MKSVFLILPVLFICSFCKDFHVMYMRAKFPLHVFNQNDSLHFGPDDFDQRNWSATEITDMDKFLQNGNSCTSSHAVVNGYFIQPLMKIDLGGDTAFIVAEGDTTDIWIYEGKRTNIYMYKSGKLQILYELAWGGAGEGPWYETDSWILDLNHDKKPDILTREIGEWLVPDSTGELVGHSQDDLTAVTWNDTGFVQLKIQNPDSLRKIYRNYFKDN